jgi:pimeloyl-ACP methyl ester carboxylesterase
MRRAPKRSIAGAAVVLAGAAVVVALTTTSAVARPESVKAPAAKPTVVLVHGAFADASGWSAEIKFLTERGYPVIAPADPLRGLSSDAAYIHDLLATVKGPVVLVGHSYGGAVIASAAVGASNVKALVYVSAFIPQVGRAPIEYITAPEFPGSLLSQTTLLLRPIANPLTGKADSDVYIQPADFHAIFAADQTATKAGVLAAEQRPLTYSGFGETAKVRATQPSWDLVSLNDKAIPPAAQLLMAKAAGAHVTAIHSAHDSLITHPDVVDSLILKAIRSIH